MSAWETAEGIGLRLGEEVGREFRGVFTSGAIEGIRERDRQIADRIGEAIGMVEAGYGSAILHALLADLRGAS